MTAYFSHDSNARNDERILRLRLRHGARGYGIYFMLLERMRDEADYTCALDLDTIAYDLREKKSVIESVIRDFGLFDIDEENHRFTSASFQSRMKQKDAKSIQCRAAANEKWEKRRNQKNSEQPADASAMRTQCERNANASDSHTPSPCTPSPESKVKKSEEKKNKKSSPLPPSKGAEEEGLFSSLPTMPTIDSPLPHKEVKPIAFYTDTAGRVAYIIETLSNWGETEKLIYDFLRYTDLGSKYFTSYWLALIKKDKMTVSQAVDECRADKDNIEAPFAAIDAVLAIGKLVPNVDDRETIINTFRTGTLAERKAAADRVNSLIATINLRRGTLQAILNPISYLRHCLNIPP